MASFFFGSSNVYRNYTKAVESGLFSGRNLQLVQCTKKAVFDSHLASLTSAGLIVTSVLENFITDVCSDLSGDKVSLFAHQQLTAHVEALHSCVQRLPEVSVLICPPMFRATPSWFGSYLPDFLSFLTSEVSRIGSSRIRVCQPFVVLPNVLEKDGVHLSAAAGQLFLSHIDAQLRSFLVEAPVQTAETTQPMEVSDDVSEVPISVEEKVEALVKRTSEFESFVRRRFKDDDLVFARLKEEADAELNRAKEDRVVISGLAPPPLTVTSHAEKKKHYIDVITRLVSLACASSEHQPKVLDVYVNLRKDVGQPLVEARFETVPGAQTFRREGVSLAKAEHAEFCNLFFSNAVTQATRVRIEVLKALSKKLSTPTEAAYVLGFISRPVMQYQVQEGARSSAEGTGRSYNYVDAISRFGSRLTDADLASAYLRAGLTFRGSMSQYFVVLRDELVTSHRGRSNVNRVPLGRRGAHASSNRRGYPRSRGRSFAEAVASRSAPIVLDGDESPAAFPNPPDRGTKRPGDHPEGPSKRNENDLNIVEK